MPAVQLEHADSRAFFSQQLGVPEPEIRSDVERYNRDFAGYGNEVYEKITTRIAHWWNYQDHNWFARRVDLCLDRLLQMPRPLFVDIGFSVPYLHADSRFFSRTDIQSLLIDKHSNVIDFYKAAAKLVPAQRQGCDRILIADIDRDGDRGRVRDAVLERCHSGTVDSVLLSAMELIEHLDDDGHFWELAADVCARCDDRPLLYITLPVGGKIPSHNMSFASEDDALGYLRRHMEVSRHLMLTPPPEGPVSPYLTGCVCAFGRTKT